ncbi:3-demethylubiquinone-9 3-methyltransferase [Candidatus Blochmanniella floridana]|uniref:Ubiquinone biosynthesis O-methyltransferase n=1 Tax=Blochmanniella floridana TaxID=203907 RepID=Q7VRW8_BLOFL|nr:3-demethylubiquinone-9 3-methyltransferase [Candidatus Blochmannia floridanus]
MIHTVNKIFKKHSKNINKKEINFFNTFATQWWNNTGVFKSLHHINEIRANYIIKNSHNLFKKKVLDIGCGGGLLSEKLAQAGAKVVGLDISPNSLIIAKAHALSKNLTINYILETAEEHALKYIKYYDLIACMELLEHVPDPLSIIHACSSMVKVGGSVFFSTLNRTMKAWLLVIIGAEYLIHLLPIGTHTFNKFITPSELLNWIDTTKLEANNITGIYYNPFNYYCTLTQDISVNYILYTQCMS